MDISQILTEYGAYYEKSKQNKKRVLSLLMQAAVTEGIMTPIKTDDTVFKLANATIDDILQPFQKGWTPNEAMAFVPNELRQYHFKVDEELYPDDIEASWLGFLASDDLDRSKWPLVKFIIERFYIPKIKDNYELKEIFKGVAADPTPGTAGATGTTMNGLRKLLIDGIVGGTMNKVSLEALTTGNIFAKVEEFFDAISQIYQGIPLDICMSPSWARAYKRDKRAEFGYQENDLSGKVDFTSHKVKGLPSMAGSDIIFASPKSNIIALSKKSQNQTRFKIETLKRQVFFMTDFWKGIGFGIDGAVWAYVPEAELDSGSGSGSGGGA